MRRLLPFLLLAWCSQAAFAQGAVCTNGEASGKTTATSWTPWECVLEVADTAGHLAGRSAYLNRLRVIYSAPGAETQTGYAAWDGVANGKHRFVLRHLFDPSPTSAATWTWRTFCESSATCGTGKTSPSLESSGQVVVTNYTGSNGLQKKGRLEVSRWSWYEGGVRKQWRKLRQRSAGESFVWVGDSAWAAPMRADDAEWNSYLDDRSRRHVSVIQIGPAPLWAGSRDRGMREPFTRVSGCTTTEKIVPTRCDLPNPDFWRAFETKIEAANQKGLYIFLSGMMEPRSDHPPGTGPQHFPTLAESLYFAHWLSARLGGSFVVFSPGFDAETIVKSGRVMQSAVGQELKKVNPWHLVTNHWATVDLPEISALHNESWLSFEMFQSGHNNGNLLQVTQRAREMAWKISGAGASAAVTAEQPFLQSTKAAINGEAIYDQGGAPTADYSNYRARQAGYLSWLSGAAGYSFGVGGIWDWGVFASAMPDGWKHFATAMTQGSATSMEYLAKIMRMYGNEPINTPEPYRILDEQTDETRKMVLARTTYSILAYLPHNQEITIRYLPAYPHTSFNPATAMFYRPMMGDLVPAATTRCSTPADSCTWLNSGYQQGDPAQSDRVLKLSATPARLWQSQAKREIQTFAGKLADDAPWGINGWLLDSAYQPIGDPFPIAAIPGVEASSPWAAHDGRGDFLVVWQASREETGENLGIFGQRVDAAGKLTGASFRVSPADDREVGSPHVALDQDGNAVIVWRSTDPVTGNGEIWAREASRQDVLSRSHLVAAGEDLDCSQPKVVMSRNGSLSVAWVERDNKVEREEIRLRHFGRAKFLKLPLSERVNSMEAPAFSLIHLHLDDSGKLDVEYEARFGSRAGGVYLQSFAADGAKLGGELQGVPPAAAMLGGAGR